MVEHDVNPDPPCLREGAAAIMRVRLENAWALDDTKLDKIKNLHSLDSIDTESLSTRGRSTWVRLSPVKLLGTSRLMKNVDAYLPERVGPLGTGVAGPGEPNPARRSGAELDEQGWTNGLVHDGSVPVNS